jgi:hypothetical protein
VQDLELDEYRLAGADGVEFAPSCTISRTPQALDCAVRKNRLNLPPSNSPAMVRAASAGASSCLTAQYLYTLEKEWRELLSDTAKIAQAELRFKSSQKEREDKQSARKEYEEYQDATRKKTERLRALRLAKEATEASIALSPKPARQTVSRRKASARS